MTIAERHRQQFFRSKVEGKDREQIGVLASRFSDDTEEIMFLAEVIEDAINRRLAKKANRWKPEEPCEKS